MNDFVKWYDCYRSNLKDMYYILIKNLKDSNLIYKTTFKDFCIFVYNNSSKRII